MTGSFKAVIPARNESATIAQVVKGALANVDRVIVVDDHSKDDSGSQSTLASATVTTNQQPRGYLKSLKSGVQPTTVPISDPFEHAHIRRKPGHAR